MAHFLTQRFGPDAGTLGEAVGAALDKTVTSDEERKSLASETTRAATQYDLEMARLGLDENKALLADVADARRRQNEIQTDEQAGWLSKNVQSMLAIGIIGLTFVMYYWIIGGGAELSGNGMKDIVIYILGALTTVSTQVASYFFGSSQGSADKQKALHSLARKADKKA